MLTCFGLRVIWWFVHFKRSSVSVKYLNCPLTITQQGRPSISKSILIYVGFLLYLFMVFVFFLKSLASQGLQCNLKKHPWSPGDFAAGDTNQIKNEQDIILQVPHPAWAASMALPSLI